ncbi:MAG: hypothetical protein AAF585_27135, partial [Verrucomicrobiota bacterium]
PELESLIANLTYQTYPLVNFQGIENLMAGSHNDAFTFLNQASLSGQVGGGGGSDQLFIDDTGLTGNHNYRINNGLVSRNPTYDFGDIEAVGIQTGSGDNRVSTSFFDFQQNFIGGAGRNVLGVLVPTTVTLDGNTSPLTPQEGSGFGPINFQDFDAVILGSPTDEGTIKTKVVDRPADGNGARPEDGIRVREFENIPNTEGMLRAEVEVVTQQLVEVSNQINSDSQDSSDDGAPNPNPGVGPQQNPAPQNNAPPGQSQDVENNDGPVEMDNGGSRTSVNMPQAVQQRFNNMFNPGDWQGTGLNIN